MNWSDTQALRGWWEPTGYGAASEAARKDTGRVKTTTPTPPLCTEGSQGVLISRSLRRGVPVLTPRGRTDMRTTSWGHYGSKGTWVRQTAGQTLLWVGLGGVDPTLLKKKKNNGASQRSFWGARSGNGIQVRFFSPRCWSSGSCPAPAGDPVVSKSSSTEKWGFMELGTNSGSVGYSEGIPATHTILGKHQGSSTGVEKWGFDGAGNQLRFCWIFQRNSSHTQSWESPKLQAQGGDPQRALGTHLVAGSVSPAPSRSSAIPAPNPSSSQILDQILECHIPALLGF